MDGLIDLQAILAANDGTPTHLILSPTAWASLRKLKRATGSAETILGVGASDATLYLLDVPVVVSAVGNVQVAQSEHIYFDSDSVALRCTWRFGQNVVRPERIGKFTVTDSE